MESLFLNKDAVKESQKLFDEYLAAQAVNHQAEVARLEEELWGLHLKKEKALVLAHGAERAALTAEMDRLRSQIRGLQSGKSKRIDESREGLRKFLYTYKGKIVDRLRELYIDLEKVKKYTASESGRDPNFGFIYFRVQSNITPVLEAQLSLSRAKSEILESLSPLPELFKQLEDVQKAVPKSFSSETFTLMETELLDFRNFFQGADKLHPDFQTEILSEAVIRREIKSIEFLRMPQKAKVPIAA